jgi:hypothetical protein
MDGSSGPPSIGQAGMVSGSEAVLSTGSVMGPGGIPQMGRNMNMPQAGQLGSMGPGAANLWAVETRLFLILECQCLVVPR